jgi:hypothetical protein
VKRIIVLLLFIILNFAYASAQQKQDKELAKWIKFYEGQHTINIEYVLLINPNILCLPCHKKIGQVLTECNTNKVLIVYYSDFDKIVGASIDNLKHEIVMKKAAFNKLQYYRYFNALIKVENYAFRTVLNINADNAYMLRTYLK